MNLKAWLYAEDVADLYRSNLISMNEAVHRINDRKAQVTFLVIGLTVLSLVTYNYLVG